MTLTRFTMMLLVLLACACNTLETSASLHKVVSDRSQNSSPLRSKYFAADSLLTFTYDQLISTFGQANVVATATDPAILILFPSTQHEIEVELRDSTQQAQVSKVVMRKNSKWITRSGLGVGMTLTEVERLNGKPFQFYGGGWEDGGRITNWNGGKFENSVIKLCRLDRNYLMSYDMSKGDYQHHQFASNAKEAQNGNPAIEEIVLE